MNRYSLFAATLLLLFSQWTFAAYRIGVSIARVDDNFMTYVRTGLGVGLLAEMAVSAADTDLRAWPAPVLLAASCRSSCPACCRPHPGAG